MEWKGPKPIEALLWHETCNWRFEFKRHVSFYLLFIYWIDTECNRYFEGVGSQHRPDRPDCCVSERCI